MSEERRGSGRRLIYTVKLLDGSVHRGEYVGAQDGFMYLCDGDQVSRVEQLKIDIVACVEVPAHE